MALLLALLTSCVVTDSLSLQDSYTDTISVRGENSVDIQMDDFFINVMEDLSNWDEQRSDDPIADVAIRDFVKNLEASGASASVSFRETGHNRYSGYFTFTDFNTLIADLSNGQRDQSLVTMKEKDGRTHVQITINMDNYSQLTRIIPFLADPNFEVYGPLYNHDLTEEEYLEMVSFILGEDCPDSIEKSSITIRMTAPTAIEKHNGKLLSDRTVEFTFPLIDFLLLHESIEFYLEY